MLYSPHNLCFVFNFFELRRLIGDDNCSEIYNPFIITVKTIFRCCERTEIP